MTIVAEKPIRIFTLQRIQAMQEMFRRQGGREWGKQQQGGGDGAQREATLG